MIRSFLLAAMLILSIPADAARAGLAQADLDDVGLRPPPGAALPLGSTLRDEGGHGTTLGRALAGSPASLLIFMDYTCSGVCGTALAIAAASLEDPALAGLHVGLVVVGLDPRDDVAEAARTRREQVAAGGPLAARSRFLTGSAETVAALTEAAGYRFRYDPQTDQFAHPAAALVVDADGRIGRTLSSLALMPDDLRLALVDVGNGRIGSLLDRIALRCYAFDPVTGLYTARIRLLLQIGALVTLLGLVGLILVLTRSDIRRRKGAA